MGRLDGSVYKDDGIGGAGTYLIDQNILELKYSDGAFQLIIFKDPFSENKQVELKTILDNQFYPLLSFKDIMALMYK